MPGPTSKHPTARARRNDPTKGFTTLPAKGRTGKAPAWPLLPDVHMTAERDLAQRKIEALQVEIDGVEDGRTKGRLRRSLAKAEQTAAVLTLQIQQADEREAAIWAEYWSSPQAVMWEASIVFIHNLALYVRYFVKAEQGDLKAAGFMAGLGDKLGTTPKSLPGIKAEIERADEAEARGRQRRAASTPAPAAPKAGRTDPRERLRAV